MQTQSQANLTAFRDGIDRLRSICEGLLLVSTTGYAEMDHCKVELQEALRWCDISISIQNNDQPQQEIPVQGIEVAIQEE